MAVVAIIGYGVAGVNAIIALRNAGYDGEVYAFSNTDELPYSPMLTSYYASGVISREKCFPWSADELDELKVRVIHEEVIQLNPKEHLLSTKLNTFHYDKCIIATGANSIISEFPQVEGDAYKPLTLRSMADADRLKLALDNLDCKRVLVSGVSMVALKILEACLNCGKKVTLVGHRPHVLPKNALSQAAELLERSLREKGVELRLGQTINALTCKAGKLEVAFSQGDKDTFNEIVVSHGMRPNLSFVRADTLKIENALVVNEFMQTSDADVYAAGDVAQATELISGTKRVIGTWKNAALQGACAGRSIAAELTGEKLSHSYSFPGSISMNTITVKGTLFIAAGSIELTCNRHISVRETNGMTIIHVLEGSRLVGFNLVCNHDNAKSSAYDIGAMLTMRIESNFQ